MTKPGESQPLEPMCRPLWRGERTTEDVDPALVVESELKA